MRKMPIYLFYMIDNFYIWEKSELSLKRNKSTKIRTIIYKNKFFSKRKICTISEDKFNKLWQKSFWKLNQSLFIMLTFVLLCLIMLYLANASKWSSLEKIFNKPIFRKFIHILRICVFHIIHILHSISTQISKFFHCRSRYFSRILRRKEECCKHTSFFGMFRYSCKYEKSIGNSLVV